MRVECPLCGGEVIGKVTSCRHCGYEFEVVHSPIAKRVVIFSGLTLFLGMLAVCSLWNLERLHASNSQPASAASTLSDKQNFKDIPVAARLSADSLYISYRGNRTAADGNYKGKMIQVSGSVSETGSDASSGPYIVLGGRGLRDGVQCFFAEGEAARLTDANVGTILTVKGRIDGKGKSVVLRDCRLP